MERLIDNFHVVNVLPPAADALSGTVYTTPIKLANFELAHFLLSFGVGLTGRSTITVEAVDNANGDNPVAIPYQRTKQAPGANPVDTWGQYGDVLAAGELTDVGSNRLECIDVRNRELPAGKPFVRLKMVESVDSPVAAAILAVLSHPRNCKIPHVSALS